MNQLETLVQSMIDHNLWDLHVATPAKVVTVDHAKQKVSVQPLIKERHRDGDVNTKGNAALPIINSVPVVAFAAGTGILSFPIKVGDTGLLLFVDRSMDLFKHGDGSSPIDPKDIRKHNLNDCVFITGIHTYSKASGFHSEDTVLRMNANTGSECKISFKPNGDIQLDTPTNLIANVGGDAEVNADGNLTATIGGDTTIDCAQTTITGDLRVDGEVSAGGDVHTDAGISLENSKMIGNLGKLTSKMLPA